jgi:hypothetical protein
MQIQERNVVSVYIGVVTCFSGLLMRTVDGPKSGWKVNDGAVSQPLYRFDFRATSTYDNPEGYTTPHNYPKEAVTVRRWAEEGRIRIMP